MYSPPDKAWTYITEHDLPIHIIHMSEGGGLPPQDIVVTGVHIDDDDGVVFIRNSKMGRNWELPTGRVEESETVETALHREMVEETGRAVRSASPELAVLWVFPEKTMTNIVFDVTLGHRVRDPESEVESVSTFTSIPDNVSFNDSGRIAYDYILTEIADNGPSTGYVSHLPNKPSTKVISAIAGLTVSGVVIAGAAHKYFSEDDDVDTDKGNYTDFDWKDALDTVKER